MGDWIGLGVIAFILLCGLFGLLWLSKPRKITQEEYEKRLKDGTGSLSTAVMGLQKLLQPELEKAIEAQQHLHNPRFGEEDESGEGSDDEDETTPREMKSTKPSSN